MVRSRCMFSVFFANPACGLAGTGFGAAMLPARPFVRRSGVGHRRHDRGDDAAVSVRRRCVPRVISSNPLARESDLLRLKSLGPMVADAFAEASRAGRFCLQATAPTFCYVS